MATQLPSRGNSRGLNRRGGSSAPSRRNVPQARTSSDPGVRVPNNLFSGAEQLEGTGQALMGLSDSLFKVQNKLKKREDDRFLLEAEDKLNSSFGQLTAESIEGLDLGDPEQVKGLHEKASKFIDPLNERSLKLSPDAKLRYDHILNTKHNAFSVNIAKETTAITHQRDLNRIFDTADTIGLDSSRWDTRIGDSYLEFDEIFDSRFASLIDEQQEPEIKRTGKIRIFTRQMDQLLLEGDSNNLSVAKEYLDDPKTLELVYKTDETSDSGFAQKINSYRTRIKGIEDGRSDVQKRQLELPELIKNGFIKTKDEQRAYLFTGKMPEKTNEQKTIRGYEEAIKANTDANGVINPEKKKFIDEVFKVNQDSEYEKKRNALEQWNEDHKNASPDQKAMAEATLMNMPIAPEIQGRNEVAKAEEIAKAASGASTFMLQKLGLTPEPDKAEEIKKVEAGIKVYEDKFGPLDDKAKKRLYMEKLGLKEIELSPIDQFFKDVENLRERKIPIDNADVELVARQKLGLPLSEAEQKQAIEIEARLNSFKTVQEAKGVAEGVEGIEDTKVKDIVKQKLGLDVPPEKQNKVEKLISRIATGKKAGVILSDEEEKLLIKKEIGDIPLSEEEQNKAKELEGRLSAIKKDAEVRKTMDLETPQEPKELNASKQKLIRSLAIQTVAGMGENSPDRLTPEQSKAANKLAALTTEYVKAGDDINTANLKASIDMNDKLPKPPVEDAIDNLLQGTEGEFISEETLNSAEDTFRKTDLNKIKLSDGTGLPAQWRNVWGKVAGIFDEGQVDKATVRGRQMLLLLANDMVVALAKNPKVPVHEQKRLLNMIPEPGTFNNVTQVQEQLKLFKKEIKADIKRQRKLVKPGLPETQREAAIDKIVSLAPILDRLNKFELRETPEFKNVASINKASKKDLIQFRDANKKADWIKWGKKNPNLYKAFTKKWDAMNDSAKGE
jgi:hypothetical protein